MRSHAVRSVAPHPAIAAAFIAAAVVLGGGGTPNPGTELALQFVFVAAASAWLWMPARSGTTPVASSRAFWLTCALVVALPVVQLVPLPPGIWSGLPGQESRLAALALVGEEGGWQPLSHYPSRTLASLLAIIPALFAFHAAVSLDGHGRRWLVGTIVVMALVTALFGAVQLSFGARESPHLYLEYHRGVLTGFQANRNAAADLLLIGIAAAAAFLAPSLAPADIAGGERRPAKRRAAAITLSAILVLLFFAAVLTGSRMGIMLIPVAILAVWLILRPALSDLGPLRYLPALGAVLALALAVLFAARGGNRALGSVVDRFALTDGRSDLWQDAWFAMAGAWPFGVGVGGGQPALVAAERLETLDPRTPNRVHNDFLELALEGGGPALVLFAAIVAVLCWVAVRTWTQRPQERHFTALGVAILVIAAAHSFVDYPLRSMALACLVGTGAGLLFATPRSPATSGAITSNGSRG